MPAARADSVESPTLVEGIGDELAVAAAATAAGGVALLCWARSPVGGQFVHQMQQACPHSRAVFPPCIIVYAVYGRVSTIQPSIQY
jgi:hypothetical protein